MNRDKEILNSLLELAYIKREAMEVFFELEETLSEQGAIIVREGKEHGRKEVFDKQWELVYRLSEILDGRLS